MNPDVCYISEANIYNGVPDYLCSIEGYTLMRAKTVRTLGYSRLVMLTKEGLQYRLEEDRMEEDISSHMD